MTPRPTVICHMMLSLDGHVSGPFMSDPRLAALAHHYQDLQARLGAQGWICGRTTGERDFTHGAPPQDGALPAPEGDLTITSPSGYYGVFLDPLGKLGWEGGTIRYSHDEPPTQVIEVLSERCRPAYRSFLRERGVAYMALPGNPVDPALALERLAAQYGISRILLEGGGSVNYSFLAAGLIDELSIILLPLADGAQGEHCLFANTLGLPQVTRGFKPLGQEALAGGALWLRYRSSGD